MNLVLVGVRGAGKSAAGAELARRLGLAFVDLDAEVERLAGATVAEIFARGGEAEFRVLEARALSAIAGIGGSVVATGGGVVIAPANREALRRLGRVVWLRVSPEAAVERVAGSDRRPPLTDLDPLEEVRQVAASRRAWYEQVAHAAIETDGRAVEEVSDELEQLWHDLSRDHVR